ncbi:hypothetical protein H0H87_001123 [Tephrocybe sp. NHM501043]|nr:hypothetical protein H0H87_001123 [Tephrocybe sp. NHM501043]
MYLKSPFPDVPTSPEINAHHIFFNRPEQAEWPDYELHIDAKSGKKRTFRQFKERVQLGATALSAPNADGGLGIRAEEGEIVGIMSHNSSVRHLLFTLVEVAHTTDLKFQDYIAVLHSLLMLAVPFALISHYSTPFELEHALKLSKATRLFVNARLLPLVLPVAKKVGLSSSKIYVLGGQAKGRKSYKELVDNAKIRKLPIQGPRSVKKDTLAYLIFSSGTSGPPKAVMISHGNILYSVSQSVVAAAATADVYTPPPPQTPSGLPVGLAFLPFHHTYGLHTYAFRGLLAPMTFVILSQWNIKVALDIIPRYRITAIALIPSVVHQLVNHPGIEKVDFSSVQLMGSGAAYLPPELAAKLSSFTPRDSTFTEGYGMSECTIAAIVQPFPGILGGMKRVAGSTGILLPGMDARIVRDDGTEAGWNEPGELYLKSDNVAMGYWNNEKATRETFVDGWLRTGDKFTVNEDGYFFFADRAKDTLKVSGIQVSPVEIENALLAEPQHLISDVTVAGVSGHGRTSDEKVPRAWIVLSDAGRKLGAAATIKVLETWHQEQLSKYKWLRGGIEVVKAIPKSPTGKVLRRVLQDKYEKEAAERTKSKL